MSSTVRKNGAYLSRAISSNSCLICSITGAGGAIGHLRRIAPLEPFPGQPFEAGLRVFAVRRDLIGIFVSQLFQVESAAARKLDRVRDRLGIVREEARHLTCAFEMALGVAREPKARFIDGAGVADAGEHILKAAAGGIVIEHIVGGDERHARRVGKGREPVQPLGIVSVKAAGGGKIDAAFQPRRQAVPSAIETLACFPRFETHRPAGAGLRSALPKSRGNPRRRDGTRLLGFPLWAKTPSPQPSPQGERGKELRPSPQAGGQFGRPLSPGERDRVRGDFPLLAFLKTRSDFPTVSSRQSRP